MKKELQSIPNTFHHWLKKYLEHSFFYRNYVRNLKISSQSKFSLYKKMKGPKAGQSRIFRCFEMMDTITDIPLTLLPQGTYLGSARDLHIRGKNPQIRGMELVVQGTQRVITYTCGEKEAPIRRVEGG